MISFTLNGETVETDADPNTMLLIFLREELGLTGTKYGCGAAMCGACMIHMQGAPMFSCQITLASVAGMNLKTIEGLSENDDHPLQKAWIEEQVPQCGYCQSGQIMRAAALLDSNPSPSEEEIRTSMSSNLCRCGTYNRIVKAVQRASSEMSS
ncbi:MAG: (2Fe-2S)-binding protein [Woeseiaceae bacterium]|nr:(2Fe-2S)-binding protein [Woeseiaceae bacterium]